MDAAVLWTYTQSMPGQSDRQKLTESEGRVLALIAQLEKPTAYTVYAVFAATPTGALQASKGAIYPIVERLKKRELIEAKPVPASGRGAEVLSVTKAGIAAIRTWVTDIGDDHILAYDPLRMRIPALQFLTPEERLAWVASMKKLNQQKVDEVDAYQSKVEMAFDTVAHSAAFYALWGQSKWLDRLLIELIEGPREQPATRLKNPG